MTHPVFIIILNYNGYYDSIECINSLQKSVSEDSIDYQIIVVDNHSTDNSFELLKNSLSNKIILLQSSRNAGYAYGNNIGIQYALEHGAEYICILNNDTIIVEDFLTPCIDVLEKNDRLAIIGPMLINYNNNLVQSTGGNLSIIKGKCYRFNSNKPVSTIKESIIKCDVVFGAAMVFRSSLIQVIGLIPENYFLFYEETEWCYRAIKSGLTNCVTTKTKIIHKESGSMKALSKMQRYLMERNRTLFVKRNGTPIQFFCYLIYNFERLLCRSIVHGIPLGEYLKYSYDGIVERFDYDYVKIMEN